MVAMSAILLGIGAPIALIGMFVWLRARRIRLMHETALKLAEKGQPVPVQLLIGAEQPASDLRRGVVLVMLAVGLGLFMYQVNLPWSVAAIPLFMGIGFLIVWKLDGGKTNPTSG
ncbi:MAG TPA: DUF6249 domain-containing protein [Usitatibacteraceae bacterium]|nr:DUF6249 domain-containing protein [Usitatibacteraceae bacterium]